MLCIGCALEKLCHLQCFDKLLCCPNDIYTPNKIPALNPIIFREDVIFNLSVEPSNINFLLCVGFSHQICSLMRGGIAERGGVRVGHRIIEINGQSVVATAHEKIVQALSNSVGEVKLMHISTHMLHTQICSKDL